MQICRQYPLTSNQSYIIVRYTSPPYLLSVYPHYTGDFLFLLSTIRLDWTVSLQLHFRFVFVISVCCNLNYTVCKSESDSRRIKPILYCPHNQPPVYFAAITLTIGPIIVNEMSNLPTEMF